MAYGSRSMSNAEDRVMVANPDTLFVGSSGKKVDRKHDRFNRWRRACIDVCYNCFNISWCSKPCEKAQKIMKEKGLQI